MFVGPSVCPHGALCWHRFVLPSVVTSHTPSSLPIPPACILFLWSPLVMLLVLGVWGCLRSFSFSPSSVSARLLALSCLSLSVSSRALCYSLFLVFLAILGLISFGLLALFIRVLCLSSSVAPPFSHVVCCMLCFLSCLLCFCSLLFHLLHRLCSCPVIRCLPQHFARVFAVFLALTIPCLFRVSSR